MKLCRDCEVSKPESEFSFANKRTGRLRPECKLCQARQGAQWKKDNPERWKEYINEWTRKDRARCKELVFDHYGRACTCCGESEPVFLVIDHINEDGAEHRKRIQASRFYQWLVRQGFPEEFQTLCHNCNFAKSRGGCPHAARKKEMELSS